MIGGSNLMSQFNSVHFVQVYDTNGVHNLHSQTLSIVFFSHLFFTLYNSCNLVTIIIIIILPFLIVYHHSRLCLKFHLTTFILNDIVVSLYRDISVNWITIGERTLSNAEVRYICSVYAYIGARGLSRFPPT